MVSYGEAYRQPDREMSDEQMYANVRALNRLFGGSEED